MVIHDVDDLGYCTPVLGTPPLGLGELSQDSFGALKGLLHV